MLAAIVNWCLNDPSKPVAEIMSGAGGKNGAPSWPHAALAISTLVFCAYLAVNWQFSGPTYLTDEIGYLANAAFLTGSRIDAASSYHFGYSLFLLPGFALGLDDRPLWIAVLVTNALIFAAAFALLYRLSGDYHDDPRARTIAVLLCAAYPAYVTISGYAYSQPAFVLVFVAACTVLSEREWRAAPRILGFSLLTGFLYWIHPTGAIAAMAGILVMVLTAVHDRRFAIVSISGILLIVTMVASYRLAFGPWLIAAMTPDGFEPRTHYPGLGETVSALLSFEKLPDLLGRMFGMFTYFYVSTLSVIVVGFVFVFKDAAAGVFTSPQRGDRFSYLHPFLAVSLVGMAAITALSFVSHDGLEKWMYGRYVEGVTLPFLMIGLLSLASPRLIAAVSLIGATLSLILFLGWMTTWTTSTNQINLAGFWPFAIGLSDFVLWALVLGGLAAALAAFLTPRLRVAALLAVFAGCILFQLQWHSRSFVITSYPSGLHRFISALAPEKRCVGFDYGTIEGQSNVARERFNQLSYYFRNHDYRRMTVSDWLRDCDGFYITYAPLDEMMKLGAVPIAREIETGITAYAKTPLPPGTEWNGSLLYLASIDPSGVVTFAGRINAREIARYIDVGRPVAGAVTSNARGGTLFYGPYFPLDKGLVRIRLIGSATDVEGAYFEVVDSEVQLSGGRHPLSSGAREGSLLLDIEFINPQLHDRTELHLMVEGRNRIAVERIEITVVPDR